MKILSKKMHIYIRFFIPFDHWKCN